MLELRVPGQRRRYGEVEKLEVWRYWCSGGVVQWRCLIICMIVVGGFNCARPYLLTVLASVKCWLGSLQFR